MTRRELFTWWETYVKFDGSYPVPYIPDWAEAYDELLALAGIIKESGK